jgi:transposase InsO family protein
MALAAEAMCMVTGAFESPHRLVIAPGEIALRDTRLVRIEARLSSSMARVQDLATGQIEDVSLSDLRGRAMLTDATRVDQILESSRACGADAERVAVTREQILGELLGGHGDWSTRVRTVTAKHNVSRRTVYRWLSRYREVATTSSLIPGHPGVDPGSKRLDDTRELPVDQILQSVQIDHTLADIIVVDERDRLSVGRPWLTVAIDVFSRSVLGFYVSLDSPAVTSIGLCLTQACLPKERWLHARNLDLEWPMCGMPAVLRADNGKDFRSGALRRGCREHGIDLDFRPVATPHFGGHIERLIGSTMGRIHLLPGTTFSNPRERKDYPSETQAAMTLAATRPL